MNDIKVENKIGDAIVHRIIKAHRDRTPWKCCIVIPLLPGFTFPVDHSDASAVSTFLLASNFWNLSMSQIRIILECQTRTLFRGPNSIFSRLRKEDIDVCHQVFCAWYHSKRISSPMNTLRCSHSATGQSYVGMC